VFDDEACHSVTIKDQTKISLNVDWRDSLRESSDCNGMDEDGARSISVGDWESLRDLLVIQFFSLFYTVLISQCS